MVAGHKRYTAKDALKHPWITRNKQDKIPETLMDQLNLIESDQQLKQKIQMAFFLSIIKKQKTNDLNFVTYKKKIKHVSSKINKWHLKMHHTGEGGSEEAFSELDFMQNMTSPDQFSESSEEENDT